MYRAKAFRRGFAAALDGVVALVFLIVAEVASVAFNGMPPAENRLGAQVFLILWILYTSTEVFFAATPGKMALGLRIAAQDGTNAGFWARLLRWSTKYFSLPIYLIDTFFPGTALTVVAGLTNMFIACGLLGALNDDRLTFHDQWSGTAVWLRGTRIPPPLPAQYRSLAS